MKKFLGTFLILILFLSAGKIYASSDSAQNLSKWYNSSFQKKSEKLGAVTTAGIALIYKEAQAFLKESKDDIDAAIANFSDKQVKDSKSGIYKYQTETIKSLNDTVAELENVNFDDFVDELNIEAEIEQDIDKLVEELFNE